MDKKKSYSELLQDPRWQKKRLEILNRDNFTCQYCGCNNKTLQVHHLYYDKDRKPWDYSNDSLITLCEKCHKSETEDKKELYEKFKSLQYYWGKAGLSYSSLLNLMSKIEWYVSRAYGEEEEFNDSYKDGYVKEFLKNCFYGVFNYYDCISANKLHIDISDIVENLFPEMIKDYNRRKDGNEK